MPAGFLVLAIGVFQDQLPAASEVSLLTWRSWLGSCGSAALWQEAVAEVSTRRRLLLKVPLGIPTWKLILGSTAGQRTAASRARFVSVAPAAEG